MSDQFDVEKLLKITEFTDRQLVEFFVEGTSFLIADEQGIILFTSRPLDIMFGYIPGELIGKEVEDLVPMGQRYMHVGLREAYMKNSKDSNNRRMAQFRRVSGVTKEGENIPLIVSLTSRCVKLHRYVIAAVSKLDEQHQREAQ